MCVAETGFEETEDVGVAVRERNETEGGDIAY